MLRGRRQRDGCRHRRPGGAGVVGAAVLGPRRRRAAAALGRAARRLAAWDGREAAPAAASPGLFLRDGQPMAFHEAAVGGRAVGVPGAIADAGGGAPAQGQAALGAALRAGHRRGGGRLPRLRPASPRRSPPMPTGCGATRRPAPISCCPDGTPLAEGALLRNPALAATLRAIAEQGADALHRGPIAADIAAAVRGACQSRACMTTGRSGRLCAAAARRRSARPYRGWTLCGMPPPSSGGVAVLQILGAAGASGHGRARPRGRPTLRMRRICWPRPDGSPSPTATATSPKPTIVPVPVRGLLDPAYLAVRAQLIDRDRAIAAAARRQPALAAAARRSPPSRRSRSTAPATCRSSTRRAMPWR